MHTGSVFPQLEISQIRLVAFSDFKGSYTRQSKGRIPIMSIDKGSQGLSPELKRKMRF